MALPNVATHIAITREVAPYATTEVLFGSIAPDFAGMYRDFYDRRFRLNDVDLRMGIKRGKDIHTATDTAFDGLDDSRRLLTELAGDLRAEEGLSRGAVKALTDVGTDILLDGEVIKDNAVAELFKQVGKSVLSGSLRIRNDLAGSPVEDVAKDYFQKGVPTRYQDPEFVAGLMQKRLEKRGSDSLVFSPNYIDFVASAYEKQIGRIKKVASALTAQTVRIVTEEFDEQT